MGVFHDQHRPSLTESLTESLMLTAGSSVLVSGLTVVLHWSWEYTWDGFLEKRAFIFFFSASLVYLLSLFASAASLC